MSNSLRASKNETILEIAKMIGRCNKIVKKFIEDSNASVIRASWWLSFTDSCSVIKKCVFIKLWNFRCCDSKEVLKSIQYQVNEMAKDQSQGIFLKISIRNIEWNRNDFLTLHWWTLYYSWWIKQNKGWNHPHSLNWNVILDAALFQMYRNRTTHKINWWTTFKISFRTCSIYGRVIMSSMIFMNKF